ncbi:MAG: HNH endonuclease [Pseudomonas sp.]
MAGNISAKRSQAFSIQSSRCCYCGYQMWLVGPEAFAKRLGISVRQALQLRCTAEHLLARCDGGPDTASNIAAACLTCNRRRHSRKVPPAPEAYKTLIARRLDAGGWHSVSLRSAK